MKFFVAKVDPQKVKFEDGRAALSPLRFHYDSEEFALPVRLGLANSSGHAGSDRQHPRADQRYEVANYPNVTIPTNLDVTRRACKRPVRRVLRGAVRSHASRRIPARSSPSTRGTRGDAAIRARARRSTTRDLLTLGADVLDGDEDRRQRDFVLTRLHARYGKDDQGRPRVQARRSRSSAAASIDERDRRSSSTARQPARDEQLPGPLRDPPSVDRPDRVREAAARHLGRAAGRRPAESADQAGDRARVRAARQGQARASVVKRDMPEIGVQRGRRRRIAGSRPRAAAGRAAAPRRPATKPKQDGLRLRDQRFRQRCLSARSRELAAS